MGTETRLGKLVALSVVAVLVALPFAGSAQADGDPASDVLLGENVFYPYAPAVSGSLQKRLNAETSTAAHAHFPVKVALIHGPTDLGIVPELFGKPQTYAHFLDQELRFVLGPHVLLLVVMPNGYGTEGLPAADTAAAAALPKPSGTPTDDLAQAAIVAVRKLAAAAGNPIGRTVDASSTTGGGGPWAVVILGCGAIAIAGALLFARRRLYRAL